MDQDTKINLTLSEVKHLQSTFAKHAADKLEASLPGEENDPLKTKVSALLNDFIYEIFENARHSLNVDGAEQGKSLRALLENPRSEVEPFDFSLQEKVRRLYQEVETETIRLTNLRRETPHTLKETYEQSFEKSFSILQSFQKEIENLMDKDEHDKTTEEQLEKFEDDVKPRLDNMAKEYERSLVELKQIKDDIPQERAELEKLDHITKFLTQRH